MAQGPAPDRRLSPQAVALALAPACHALEAGFLALIAGPRGDRVAGPWRARLGPHDDATLATGWAQAATLAALLARHRPPGGWLADTLADLDRHHRPLAPAIHTLEQTLAAIDPRAAAAVDDPAFHCFEYLIHARDAQLRDAVGAYYTPAEVVHAQCALVESALDQLGRTFADRDVRVVDPACGTGIYPTHLLTRMLAQGGPEACARLAENLVACELLPGPAIVAQARLAELHARAGLAQTPHIRCRDILADPAPLFTDGSANTLICLGNPPYSRQIADIGEARRGGWIRHGTPGHPPILADFVAPAGLHAKNLYNDYVYFWRWAAWTAFECDARAGVVALVTASSFLRGPGFTAMREHLRGRADELWILDLGGDSLGARKSANVFAIRSPVCIALALRRPGAQRRDAAVWYARLPESSRDDKLRRLAAIDRFADVAWTRVTAAPSAPLVPRASGDYAAWPALTELMPWRHSGAQFKRTWPIAETRELLLERWRSLLSLPPDQRRLAFRETRDRTIDAAIPSLLDAHSLPPLAGLPADAPPPEPVRYAWRSFDRRWCLPDARLGDFLRPVLWRSHGPRQLYFTTLLTDAISRGPAVTACAHIPDLHHHSGRGGADVLPLWHDRDATTANLAPGLLASLARALGIDLTADDLFAYFYGCLAHPHYSARLADGLADPGPRVPVTADPRRFVAMAGLGRELLHCHSFGERMGPPGVRPGRARCLVEIPPDAYPEHCSHGDDTLHVGRGRLAPVPEAVWRYEVSGLRVLPAWLGHRMLAPRGRASSPLDRLRPLAWTSALTVELLELLWTLERSLVLHARQAALLDEILGGPLLRGERLVPGE